MTNQKKLGKKREQQKRRTIVLFLIIPLFFLLYFTIYPIAKMLFYSLTDWKGSASPYQFVGFSNYLNIFATESYRNVFFTGSYYLGAGLIQQVISLFLAVVMNKKIQGSGIFKGIIFFPFIMNGVAVAMVFRMFYQVNGGLDTLMNIMGMQDYIKIWIGNPKTCNYALALVYLWKNVGYSFLIYLGTMQSIPAEYYDAASIDGAGMWAQFTAITFPNIKMIVGLMATLSIVNSIAIFDIPYVLTNGKNGSNTFSTTLIETAFTYNKYGQACAMAICVLAIAGVVMVFKNIVFKEENENSYE